MVSNILPVLIFSGGFSRVVYSDFIFRHIEYHRRNTAMMEIIKLGFAEIKKVDDFGDVGARVIRI